MAFISRVEPVVKEWLKWVNLLICRIVQKPLQSFQLCWTGIQSITSGSHHPEVESSQFFFETGEQQKSWLQFHTLTDTKCCQDLEHGVRLSVCASHTLMGVLL